MGLSGLQPQEVLAEGVSGKKVRAGARTDMGRRLATSCKEFAADIKIAHSVFALPFAAVGLLLGHQIQGEWPENIAQKIVLLLLAMISARSFAMGANRLLDRKFDGDNPRTATRAIPAGRLKYGEGIFWTCFAAVAFIVCARLLNPLAGMLSIPLLGILASYSLMKRLTAATHLYLGACLGLAPIAVNIALWGIDVRGFFWVLGAAVMFWTAGFDILYSLQDIQFDRQNNLRSIPARFGMQKAVWMSRACFVAMVGCLIFVGNEAGTGWVYGLGVAVVAAILGWEHWTVRDVATSGDLSPINKAFFDLNALVSVGFYLLVQIDVLWNQ